MMKIRSKEYNSLQCFYEFENWDGRYKTYLAFLYEFIHLKTNHFIFNILYVLGEPMSEGEPNVLGSPVPRVIDHPPSKTLTHPRLSLKFLDQ